MMQGLIAAHQTGSQEKVQQLQYRGNSQHLQLMIALLRLSCLLFLTATASYR